jgi:hypothetical protein
MAYEREAIIAVCVRACVRARAGGGWVEGALFRINSELGCMLVQMSCYSFAVGCFISCFHQTCVCSLPIDMFRRNVRGRFTHFCISFLFIGWREFPDLRPVAGLVQPRCGECGILCIITIRRVFIPASPESLLLLSSVLIKCVALFKKHSNA